MIEAWQLYVINSFDILMIGWAIYIETAHQVRAGVTAVVNLLLLVISID